MSYFQLKHNCLYCDAAFVVCTTEPENYVLDCTYCPLCGNKGTSIRFFDIVAGCVDDFVPGNSDIESFGRFVEFAQNGQFRAYSLKEEARLQIDAGLEQNGV
ncbi:hypothetical protein [Azonexus hydrophilus]|uniref:hypothetical protein n=1 Tax=Azonexus hydrophilus TaxID=418702 RepID=UPI0012F7D5FD|nr:hypothetical protein [Azonexus hydrophilus]